MKPIIMYETLAAFLASFGRFAPKNWPTLIFEATP